MIKNQGQDHHTYWYIMIQLLAGEALRFHTLMLEDEPFLMEEANYEEYRLKMDIRSSHLRTEAQRKQQIEELTLKPKEGLADLMDRSKKLARDIKKAKYHHDDLPNMTPTVKAITEKVINPDYVPAYDEIGDPMLRQQLQEQELQMIKALRMSRDKEINKEALGFFLKGIPSNLRRGMMSLGKDFSMLPLEEVLEIATNLHDHRHQPGKFMTFVGPETTELVSPNAGREDGDPEEELSQQKKRKQKYPNSTCSHLIVE